MIKWLLNNWFLLGLLALALIAIPGVILVIMRLAGVDGDINAWLLTNLQITYELRVPTGIAFVLLLLPIFLVILYFLRLKRKPIQVPSTFLWKKSVEDLHANSLLQWLRNNVLLLLQLLVLLFLIYSVLGLRLHGSTEKIEHFILMIDNSASMSVKDVEPNRLTWAKLEALKEINAAGDHDHGMVIVFNSKATILQTYTNDKEKLREAVASIKETEKPTRIEEALALAESLANPVRSTEDAAMQPDDVPDDQKRTFVQAQGISTRVHLYSDGRFAKLSEAALTQLSLRMGGENPKAGGMNLRYHMAGKISEPGNTNNLAIVGLNVLRQNVPTKKDADAQQLMAFVRVANYRSAKANLTVKLDVLIDGRLTHPLQKNVAVKARTFVAGAADEDDTDEPGEIDVRFPLPAIDPGHLIVLHAALDKSNDDFPLDDQAWLVVGSTRKAKVLIVGKRNRVLEAFFESEDTKKFAATQWQSPDALTTDEYRKKARSGEFDLVIFDRCAPESETDMPLSNTFFIDRPPPPWRRGENVLKNPLLLPSKQTHPLLRHLTTIYDIRTDAAFLFDVQENLDPATSELAKLPEGDPRKRTLPTVTRIIESSNQAPILFSLPRGPHTDLVLTFALMSDDGGLPTNWFRETSFPLFFRNVLYILGNVDDAKRAAAVSPGEPIVLRPEAGFTFVDITTPDRQTVREKPGERRDILFTNTDRLGVYRYKVGLTADEKKNETDSLVRGFAVNLLDVNESNIEPRPSIRIGNERLTTGQEKFHTREIWKWILLLSVLLLMAEWYIYHRRIAV